MSVLPFEVYVSRREKVFAQLGEQGVALIPAASEQMRSRDTEYLFRQDSYFFYLTGFVEPDALLVLKAGQSILFCREKDKTAEIWQGRRLGPTAAIDTLQLDQAYPLSELNERLPELVSGSEKLWYADGLYQAWDRKLETMAQQLRVGVKKGWKIPTLRCDLRPLLDEMRLIKDPAEIDLMRRAADITSAAHCRAMEKVHPGMMEYQLEAEIHHEFARRGARFPAYNTIVGAGDNACILHYTENQDVMAGGELVLIDAGCELEGYAADITRTFPVNGLFSQPQKQLYQLVLDAQYAAIEQVKPGNTFDDANQAAVQVIVNGLIELGILKGSVEQLLEENAHKEYFMHGIGHWLGLDVHDVGDYQREGQIQKRKFEPGMVLTIEPGLYIDESAQVSSHWQGMGIRIEDNLLVTATGHDILTHGSPKEIVEIEALMGVANAKYETEHQA